MGLGQDRTHYEPDPTPHANLICIRCGKIEDVDDPRVAALSENLASMQGLRVRAAHMDIFGFCHECEAAVDSRRSSDEE